MAKSEIDSAPEMVYSERFSVQYNHSWNLLIS